MAGMKKPKSKESIDYEKLKQAYREKERRKSTFFDKDDDRYKYSYIPDGHITGANPLLPKTPFDTAVDKALEAKTIVSTLKTEAEKLLKGEDSLEKATREARREYLKTFYPIRYKLGQIASSLSPFRRKTNSKTNAHSTSRNTTQNPTQEIKR